MNQRAASPVLGLVLLLGIVAIGAMGVFLAGMTLAESTQTSATDEQAERSMGQLAESADQLANGAARAGEFNIRGSDSTTVYTKPDAGQINVTVENRSTGKQIFSIEKSLGAVIYESSDGSHIAYQGGGVWRKYGDSGSKVVRTPEFHYRENPDPTITFPITLVREDFYSSGKVTGELLARDSVTHYPDAPNHYNPLRDGSVLIRIESEYCEGWETYFEHYTDGSAAEDCTAGEEGELVIQFSVPFEVNDLGNGVMIGGGNGDPDDFDGIDDSSEIGDASDAPSATPMVESKLEEAKKNGDVLPDDDTIDEAGLYYDDGNLSQGDVTFDTSDGDVEIASGSYPVFDGNVSIEGSNNVTVYTTQNIVDKGGGNEEIGDPENSSQLRVFVHSDVDTVGHKGQNTDFHGLLYAPNSEVLLYRGNNNASGALVAGSVDIGNTELQIDKDLADMRFYEELGDAPFYYLHISETEIVVDN